MNAQLSLLPAAVAACAVFGAAAPAHAQSDDGYRSTIVRYSDLNTRSDAGRAALRRRIANAAHKVCDMAGSGSADISIQALELACIRETMARAQTSADRQTSVRVASQ